MVRASIAAGREIDLARIGLGIGNELRNGLGRNGWVHHHDVGLVNHGRDRRYVSIEIVIEPLVERRVDSERRSYEEKRVPVRGCFCDRLSTNVAACARPILDDELL